MDLSNLKPAKGSTKNRKRIGRGQGSGYGGTLLKVAWIGVGLCCELSADGQRVPASPVQEVEVIENALRGPF